jgi:hypothetical protein
MSSTEQTRAPLGPLGQAGALLLARSALAQLLLEGDAKPLAVLPFAFELQ